MIKELLSDFSKVFFPKDLPETFEPYLSTMLTIVLVTFVIVGFQFAARNIYAYANNPSTINTDMQTELCKNFSRDSFTYICRNFQGTTKSYRISSFSVEQDLHKLTN